jgi:hypothetical protein
MTCASRNSQVAGPMPGQSLPLQFSLDPNHLNQQPKQLYVSVHFCRLLCDAHTRRPQGRRMVCPKFTDISSTGHNA